MTIKATTSVYLSEFAGEVSFDFFGAVIDDDTVDNTAAFNEAIAWMAANGVSTLRLPAGVIRIDSMVVEADGTQIVGAGQEATRIISRNTGTGLPILQLGNRTATGAATQRVAVRDFCVDGETLNFARVGVQLDGLKKSAIERVQITGTTSTGILAPDNKSNEEIYISAVSVGVPGGGGSGSTGVGLYAGAQSNGWRVNHLSVTGGPLPGVVAKLCNEFQLTGVIQTAGGGASSPYSASAVELQSCSSAHVWVYVENCGNATRPDIAIRSFGGAPSRGVNVGGWLQGSNVSRAGVRISNECHGVRILPGTVTSAHLESGLICDPTSGVVDARGVHLTEATRFTGTAQHRLILDHRMPSGSTANRPTLTSTDRFQYFDDTIGAPVWWDGAAWNEAGAAAATGSFTGDGTTASFNVAHNLGTGEPLLVFRDVASGQVWGPGTSDQDYVDDNNTTVTFSPPLGAGVVVNWRAI